MGAKLNIQPAAYAAAYYVAGVEAFDAVALLYKAAVDAAAPLIVAEGYQTVAKYIENEIAQADAPEPDGSESFRLGFTAGVTEGFRQAKLYLEMRAAELRGEV